MARGGFPGGMGNMNNLMKQAQMLQKQMQSMQEEIEASELKAQLAAVQLLQKLTERKN